MSRTRVLVTASVMVGVLLGVFGGAAHASAKCVRRYRDLALPVYDRRVTVYHYNDLSCDAAARVASATSDAYERGLPLATIRRRRHRASPADRAARSKCTPAISGPTRAG